MKTEQGKKRVLILITSEYPFGVGDPFVKSELEEIRRHFDAVHVLPVDYVPSPEEKPGTFPDRTVLHTLRRESKLSRFLFLLHFFFNRLFREERKEIVKTDRKSFTFYKMKVMLGSFSKVRRIMRELRKILSGLPHENVLLYSYWINEGVVASLLCRNNSVSSAGIRVVCRGHGWDVYAERHPESYLPWRKFIMMNADAVFCISRHGKDYLKKNFPDAEEVRLRLSCLGVPSVPAVREYPDFDADVLRIVSCSLMLPVKRIELLIKSLSLIGEIQTEWVHIGGGERFDIVSDMAAALLSGKKNITYQLKGQLAPMLRDQILGSGRYSVFINTSGSEGLPVSMMEAASCGLPMIATAVGGVPEIVRDEWNGFLLPPDPEPREIAATLQKYFMLEKSRKMEMSAASRAMWSENFNAAVNYPRFGEEISRLLS